MKVCLGDQRGDVLKRAPAEVLRELAYDLAYQVVVEVLAQLPQGPGVGDDDQVFYGPVQAELVQERGCCCREVVFESLPVGTGGAGTRVRVGRRGRRRRNLNQGP